MSLQTFESILSESSHGSDSSLFAESASFEAYVDGLSRTGLSSSLARNKGKARKKSSLSRQLSRTSSAQDRAAESARRSRKKKAAAVKAKSYSSSNIIIRGFNFVINTIAPFLGLSANCGESTDNASVISRSSSALSVSLEVKIASVSDGSRSTKIAAGGDHDVGESASQTGTESTESDDAASQMESEYEETVWPEHPTDQGQTWIEPDPEVTSQEIIELGDNISQADTEPDDSVERATINSDESGIIYVDPDNPSSRPVEKPIVLRWGLLNARSEQIRAQIDRAEVHAQKMERDRRARDQLYQDEIKMYGEQEAWKRKRKREIEEERKEAREKRALELLDEQDRAERKILLEDGEREANCQQECHDAAAEEYEKLLKQRLVISSFKCNHRYVRDRTSKSRAKHRRFHPYSSSMRPARSNAIRHFNPSESSHNSPSQSPNEPIVSLDDQVMHYEMMWTWLIASETEIELTFSSVPWPLPTTAKSPVEFTTQKIWDFLLYVYHGADNVTAEEWMNVAKSELIRWHPDNVECWIILHVKDRAEHRIIREAASIVRNALVLLMAAASEE